MDKQKHIIAGVSAVQTVDPVLPTALRLAAAMRARLHLINVVDMPCGPDDGTGDRLANQLTPEFPKYAETARHRLLDHCWRVGAGADVEVHILCGSPHHQLAHFAAKLPADLMIIGASCHEALWKSRLGITAERVLAESTVPVLVLHRPFFKEVEKILVATDAGIPDPALHETALDVVQSCFGSSGLTIRSLYVRNSLLKRSPSMTQQEAEIAERDELESFLGSLRARPYPIAARVRTGRPSIEISVEAEAWGADLLVMGSHGVSRDRRYALGSVVASTLRDTTRNVLVIPSGGNVPQRSPTASPDAGPVAGDSLTPPPEIS